MSRFTKQLFRSLLLAAILLLAFFDRPALAAGAAGTVQGRVLDPDGNGRPGVTLHLRNAVTGFLASATTGPDGSFRFQNVPFNPYLLQAEVPTFQNVNQGIEVRSPIALVLEIRLTAIPTEVVTVKGNPNTAQLETDTSMSHIDIDKSYIARAPAPVASRAMEEIITSTPGFAKDENGRYHFQGAHSQGEFVLDGQTISDQTGITFSNSIDPGIAQSMEVIYGNVPAEYGEKIGSVVNLTTTLRPRGRRAQGGGPGRRLAVRHVRGRGLDRPTARTSLDIFASINGSTSDRFVDPVNLDNLNNNGHTARGFVRLDWIASDTDKLRWTALVGGTDRGVTNTFTQETAGQDQQRFEAGSEFQFWMAAYRFGEELPRREFLRPFLLIQARPLDGRHPGHGELGPLAGQLRPEPRLYLDCGR